LARYFAGVFTGKTIKSTHRMGVMGRYIGRGSGLRGDMAYPGILLKAWFWGRTYQLK